MHALDPELTVRKIFLPRWLASMSRGDPGQAKLYFTGTQISQPPSPVCGSKFASYRSSRSGVSPGDSPEVGKACANMARIVLAVVVM
jgi:hypothetical protein